MPPRCYSAIPVADRVRPESKEHTMPATTTRVSPDVKRMLEAGQTSRFDEGSGVLRTLHANCPNDGEQASVRRMSRELGGAIMEITMRCPTCFNDFTATPESLYLSGRSSRSSSAAKSPASSAAKAPSPSAAKAPAKTAAKAPAKSAAKSPAKQAAKAAPKAAKSAPKAAAKTPAKSAAKSGAKAPAKAAAKSISRATKAVKQVVTKAASKV